VDDQEGALLLLNSRKLASHLLFRHRFGSLRAGFVLLGIAAVIGYFARNRRTTPGA